MVRTLKNRRQNRYQYDKNRKNLKKKLNSTGKIKCAEIKHDIDHRKSVTKNINEMGLVFNVNKKFPTPNYKQDKTAINKLVNGFVEEDIQGELQECPKKHVVERLEKSAKELRESKFKISKNQVKILSYYIDKYGLNYKLMVKDHKNYDQHTWRQFRQKIRKFMSIPDQFAKYLEERNIIDTDITENDPKWQESNTDLEDD
ncbi:nucleolar protein 16 [Chironomus tepperi]|uniref:nucleolar protein 16 n=1 Tax=Chironomus tepperi TaxID=113505 RepID=UPI00391F7425